LGASGAGLPDHRRGLNEARKNTSGRNRRRNEVRWRFGHDGFEHGYRDPIRFLVESCRCRLRVSPTRFVLPVIGLLAWRYSTVNEGVTRFNGILKSVKLDDPNC
jgi:hypothetical protein